MKQGAFLQAKVSLALIGRFIAHSKSPQIYQQIIGPGVKYDLIDRDHGNLLPSLEELFEKYDGISITAPYKKHYINHVEMLDEYSTIGVNCIRKRRGQFEGILSDAPALKFYLDQYLQLYSKYPIILLGNGAMAELVRFFLSKMNLSYTQYSRSLGYSMRGFKLDLSPMLIINTCSRDYVFEGRLHPQSVFWDLNYDFSPHVFLKHQCTYLDGMGMLLKQAEYSVNFWFNWAKISP